MNRLVFPGEMHFLHILGIRSSQIVTAVRCTMGEENHFNAHLHMLLHSWIREAACKVHFLFSFFFRFLHRSVLDFAFWNSFRLSGQSCGSTLVSGLRGLAGVILFCSV